MKLIKINPDHYVVVDETIQPVNGYYYDSFIKAIRDTSGAEYGEANHCWQITRSTIPKGMMLMEGIERLSLQEVKELIGELDVEKKIYALCQSECIVDDYGKATDDGMVIGIRAYNQALEDNKEKKYTEDDLRKAINMVRRNWNDEVVNEDEIIQSLHPKTEWEWEVEIVNGKLKLNP